MNAEPDVPAGLTPHEVALQLRTWIVDANGYSRNRKHRFSSLSSATKIVSLALSGSATIILGLQHLSFWAGLGFSLVALITVMNAVEPFFNWRSRQVLTEEAQHAFYRLQEDLEYLIATCPPQDLKYEDLTKLYERYQNTWDRFGEKWLEQRQHPALTQ